MMRILIGRCALSLALLPPALFCQTLTTGEISGSVLDAGGRVVVSAAVLLKSVDTGDVRSVISNSAGLYRFPFVKPGRYEISAKAAGLRSNTGDFVASVGQALALNLTLKPEEATSTIQVTDVAPLLNTDNANFEYTLSARQLDLLPLAGGDLVGVAYSAPSAIVNNHFGTGNFVVQGIGSVSNLFTVNGVDDMDPYQNVNNSGTTRLLLGANEVQEASVIQNAIEAQYGRQAGAQVNYVTKSGTNLHHGNLVYSYNGTRLNANDFLANAQGLSRPQATSNQYGASLGGPVVQDKLFFFADTEGLRYALPSQYHVADIPSQALQSYALSSVEPSQLPLYQRMFDLYNNSPGHERAIPVVNGNGPLQDNTGRLGCGTLAGTPAGPSGIFGTNVSCAQAWETNASTVTSEWLVSTRVDYNLSANQRIFFRFKTDHGFWPVNTNDVSPVFNVVGRYPDYEGQFNHTMVVMPRLVNNLIGSVTYNNYEASAVNLTAALRAFPVRVILTDGGANGNNGGAGGFTFIGVPAVSPTGRRAGQFQLVDDVSYVAGRHSLKAGLNYRYNPETDLGDAAFSYEGVFGIRRLTEYATGALSGTSPSFYRQSFTANPVLYLRLYSLGAYVQDQWAATPHLKITGAIRLDRTGNPYCLDRCFARLVEPFPDLAKGLAIPYNQSIQTGLAHAFPEIEPIVPQPRLSLAYSPGRSRGTVLRAGIGLLSDLYPAYLAGSFGGNAPNIFLAQIHSGLVNAAGAGSAPAIASASANAFRNGFASGATLLQLQQAVAPAQFAPPSYYSVAQTVRTPKFLQWTLELQRQLGSSNVLALRYVGNHGYDIFVPNQNVNVGVDPAIYPNGFGSLPAAVPDPRFSSVTQLINSGYANYHGLIAMFRRAFRGGLQGQISYTWSHSLDTLSSGGLQNFAYDSLTSQIDPARLRLNYGNSDYDVRHNLTADLVWEMPARVGNRWVSAVFGRWSLGSRLAAHTGTPFSVVNSGVGGLSAGFNETVLADVLDPKIATSCGASSVNTPCFSASQFVPYAAQSNFGNLSRNSFRGPGYFGVDASLFKNVLLRERVRFALGASAYNLLNHPSFLNPGEDVSYSGLGLIQDSAVSPSSPYGYYGGQGGGWGSRTLVVTGKLIF